MQLTKSIYQLLGEMYGSHQNVYAIHKNDFLIIVDTGKDENDIEIIKENLNYWNLSKFPVKYILLTHAHYEHSANASYWSDRGAKIIIGEEDADGIEKGNDKTASFAFSQLTPFKQCKVDRKVRDNEILDLDGVKIKVLHTPGHSEGSVVYLYINEKKVLFSGDVVLAEQVFGPETYSFRARVGWTGGVDFDRNKMYNSLVKISHLDIDALLPGHGYICMYRASKLLFDVLIRARTMYISPLQTIGDLSSVR
jgi:glyoxylase-like metal-dependent hydrolase (beta-lactamase superfamily II)